ncbi:hypothetical protein KIV65_gp44 [Mycobacterium phage Anthony]|uniref:Uncharacterized protein n=1 Tax=Mycobacterium phage Anthony TaxID=2599857 RepID=A0A5J6THF9_9CAUD|nr:hypothetical protein KIV65_gp44 [Mycobacterium phage Anthony]QFG10423.1 hypothetical protein PBI_ANTHONY_53 [Mycobacterium phage Anthony]
MDETGDFTLTVDLPELNEQVTVKVSGWKTPLGALTALRKVGSEETALQIAKGFDEKIEESKSE